jgi:AcrR family transcriptional regulator
MKQDQDNARPLRSQPTRDRILHEARRLFAELGFEKTTIRAVAAAAAINPSMVMRYYKSKEELFATAARIDFRMPDLVAVPSQDRGVALVTHILDQWDGPTTGEELQALLRAAGTHELARRRLVELVEKQAVPVIRSVLPRHRTEERLGLIIMQLTGLVLSRYFLKHPSVMALKRAALIRRVGTTVQHYMMASLPAEF